MKCLKVWDLGPSHFTHAHYYLLHNDGIVYASTNLGGEDQGWQL